MDIKIPERIVKPILWFTQHIPERFFAVVCKGYGEDWDYYTGLCWNEDRDNDLSTYEDFQVWLNIYRMSLC